MIPIRQFDALLQTQSLNNKMFQTLVQGSEDTAIKATIQQDGKNIQIDTGAEIELSVLYNGGTTQTYHTDKTKSDFPATIESDGTLIIKFNEMMTTVFGTHKLFLKIVDTNHHTLWPWITRSLKTKPTIRNQPRTTYRHIIPLLPNFLKSSIKTFQIPMTWHLKRSYPQWALEQTKHQRK